MPPAWVRSRGRLACRRGRSTSPSKTRKNSSRPLSRSKASFLAEAIFKFDAADADVEGTLAPVGVAFVQKLCEPDRHLSMRAVIAIADRMPSIGRMFYETGPAVGIAKMREYLGAEVAAGRLNIPTAKWRRHSSWICATHAVQADVLQLRPAAASGADRVRGWPRREDLYGGVPEAVRRRHSGEWSTVGLCSVDGSSCAH
jgi:AefR-like transcriptional repressor, C-terminal domain